MVQQMAVATVLMWATWFSRWQVLLWAAWFSRWQWQQYYCGPHGSAHGNSIAVGHRVQHMAMATVLLWVSNSIAVGHMVQQMAVVTLLLYNQNVLIVTFELFVFLLYYLS